MCSRRRQTTMEVMTNSAKVQLHVTVTALKTTPLDATVCTSALHHHHHHRHHHHHHYHYLDF